MGNDNSTSSYERPHRDRYVLSPRNAGPYGRVRGREYMTGGDPTIAEQAAMTINSDVPPEFIRTTSDPSGYKQGISSAEHMTGGYGPGEPRASHSTLTILAVIIVALLVLFMLCHSLHLNRVLTQFLMSAVVVMTSLYLVEILTR